jgi:membrane protein required for colicin V production
VNALDIVLIVILGFGAIAGFRKGFVMEIVSILAFILAVIGSFKLLQEGMKFMQENFELSGKLLPYLTFIILFVMIVILVNLAGKAVKKMLDMTLLGSFDNLAGGIVGLFKWAFGLSVLIWIFNYFQINPIEKYADDTIVYPMVTSFAPLVVEYISAVIPFAEDLFSTVEEITV